MRYATDVDFRVALEQRLANAAQERQVDVARLRRQAVFERILDRLAADDSRWILKGGVALEVRLGDRARATRDLDLATDLATGEDLRDVLVDVLSTDRGDGFAFTVGPPRAIMPDTAGQPGWRVAVTARLGGREFASVRMEVVARMREVVATERMEVPTLFDFVDLPRVRIETVDRCQHFAEKLHALTRDYGDRPNTRVKDLVDLVLLIEDGLPPDADLARVAAQVFAARDTHPMPTDLPAPSPGWASSFAESATFLDLRTTGVEAAMHVVGSFWDRVLDVVDAQGDDQP